ncbi:leucyl/phenylalanyl-tRNA/protein transferase [Prosthecochloris aestuarii DSM 271]|uniref:Leucyl/phenylalanyl-tRNA--protein transferase n=1 Tax=Prosthecochloris aestuarii (strain DSM 271 / SK 413) TaxID=290512 RepID=LFTR_PROA2|nr:leucyl/phenylalanyl-tRNA--protein transferase [Prosthecochloris aestuarii]B4S3F9.1 RecName: Full=Leucyl/phenylalanyl-tRNA--protein transferase; AltName: Full=L/F-transferase; AltName: Full=Leucyltransferase; AltName: Full=Phenyalanyltransferase [Prosthecochloris aestuarii DSM 271]ACF46698.1 leucyl/phenylalanyl-tRNA/protein transferase [Prosthecochloris aestuarii DSM 271]
MLNVRDVLRAYLHGYFPMGDPDDGNVYWCRPRRRAVFPLDTYRASRVVRRLVRDNVFDIQINRDFNAVIAHCAKPRRHESETWISDEIVAVYLELHSLGLAHSVECYADGELAGGLYGIALGGAFFGESMFFRQPNASKVAFDALVRQLKLQRFDLLDAQIMNPHLEFLGAVEIDHEEYMRQLAMALEKKISFL